jgi:hypothetical protein
MNRDQKLIAEAYDQVTQQSQSNGLQAITKHLSTPSSEPRNQYSDEADKRSLENLKKLTNHYNNDPKFAQGVEVAYKKDPEGLIKFISNLRTNGFTDRLVGSMSKGIIPNPMWVWG